MSTVGDQYTVDFYPAVGAALTGLSLQSLSLPSSPTAKAMSITRKVDSASPKFYAACAAGKHFSKVVLSMRKASGAVYMMTMNNCTVTGMSRNSNGTDTVSWSYSQATSNLPASAGISTAAAAGTVGARIV